MRGGGSESSRLAKNDLDRPTNLVRIKPADMHSVCTTHIAWVSPRIQGYSSTDFYIMENWASVTGNYSGRKVGISLHWSLESKLLLLCPKYLEPSLREDAIRQLAALVGVAHLLTFDLKMRQNLQIDVLKEPRGFIKLIQIVSKFYFHALVVRV